jgi:hypothetical protein
LLYWAIKCIETKTTIMAKVRTNNGGDPNKVPTKDYKKVYNQAQLEKMSKEHGDDPKNYAAAIKKDIGNDKLPRARYGTEGHKQAVKESMANTAKRMEENKPGSVKKKIVYKGSK